MVGMTGVEINDCMMISDNDLLFLSCGEDFIAPTTIRKDGSASGKTDPTVESRRGSRLTEIGPYTIGDLLGKGGFGEVRMGTNNLTGEKVALKFMRKSEIMNLGAAERTATELQCLSMLKHPHIIFLHTVRPNYCAHWCNDGGGSGAHPLQILILRTYYMKHLFLITPY
jgi:serine/threonine protein kinase